MRLADLVQAPYFIGDLILCINDFSKVTQLVSTVVISTRGSEDLCSLSQFSSLN